MFFSESEDTFLAEIKKYISASAATSKEKLWSHIEAAERKFILPILGRATYDDLQLFFNNRKQWTSGSGDDVAKTTELLKLIQLAEINLAYFIGFDLINARISDQGFQRAETEKFKGLYKYQEENVREYFKNTGFNGLDDILQYLEDNMEYFPEWEDSDAYTLRKTSFIGDTKSFNKICDINNSRLIFLRLQPFIQQVLDIDIKVLLGNTIWTALTVELAKNNPDAKYTALAAEIRKPLAFLSIALLIKSTGNLTDKGLYFEGKMSGFPDNTTSTAAIGSAAADSYTLYGSTGEQYLEALRRYLIDNSFPGYTAITGGVYMRDNDGKKTFFA
jgi:hypothetical protein